MRIGLIGCGRVGLTIFNLLSKSNTITGVYDINKKKERAARTILHLKSRDTLSSICRNSTALFFATPDDVIAHAYHKALPSITPKTYLYHFSGILPASIFSATPLTYRGSIHPFATFPSVMTSAPRTPYTLFFEGSGKAFRTARRIFCSRHFTIRKISIKNKTYYHLIGVFSSNLLIGLRAAIEDVVANSGWKGPESRVAVAKLIDATLLNVNTNGVESALSGPLVRGDIKVLRAHLKALSSNPHLLNIYKSLSVVLIKHLNPAHKKELLSLFR
jgi:predicted short-subunit dehydrogenase-like oxidoreductase (DUF2520 family)